jgi:hypothetical protein
VDSTRGMRGAGEELKVVRCIGARILVTREGLSSPVRAAPISAL